MSDKEVDLLSLRSRQKSESKAFEQVIIAEVLVGLISVGNLLYMLLNLLVKLETDSPFYLFRLLNSVI